VQRKRKSTAVSFSNYH